MSVTSFVAAQRTEFGVPHVVACRALELSESWFYKSEDRPPTSRLQRQSRLDVAVHRSVEESDGDYGSPWVRAGLRADGRRVSKKSVEVSMAREGLVGRATRRRFRSLTRPHGGDVAWVIFRSDRGSEYSADLFETACGRLGVRRSMGPIGSCFDNAASETFHSTLEFELLLKRRFATKAPVQAGVAVAGHIDCYNRTRGHRSCETNSPVDYEAIIPARVPEAVTDGEAA